MFAIQISVCLIDGYIQEIHLEVFKTIHCKIQILMKWIELIKYIPMYFMSSSFFLVNSRVSSIYLIQNFSFPDSINSCNIFFCCSVMITFAKIGPKKEEPKETPSLCLYYNDIFQSCLMFRSKLICLVYISFGSKKWDKLAHKSKKV